MTPNTDALRELLVRAKSIADELDEVSLERATILELSAALAQRQQVPTTAWLVEWRFNGVQWLYLWPSAPGGFSFTSDASKALRFARREDAEAALQWARNTDAARRPIGSLTRHGLALGEMLVTEHDWPALTAAPSAQAEPVGWVVPEHLAELQRDYSRLLVVSKDKAGFCTAPIYTAPPAAQAEPQVPLPFNSAQRRRLWDNSPEIHADAKSFAAFERIVQLVEAARGIGKQEG